MATDQYSCLGNPMDRGAWGGYSSPWGLKESDMTKHTHIHASPWGGGHKELDMTKCMHMRTRTHPC